MLAEVIKGMIASSVLMPSPISQFKSQMSIQKFLHSEFTCNLQLIEVFFLIQQFFFCCFQRSHSEPDDIIGFFLGQNRKVGGYYMRHSWIAACCLMVGHQDDQLSFWKELH